MQRLALAATVQASGTQSERVTYRPTMGAYFGLGLLGGGMAGAAVLLGLQVLAPGQGGPSRVQVPTAIAALAHWVPDSGAARVGQTPRVAQPEPADAFDVVIERAVRADAPFALRLVGSNDARMEVLLRDVPSAAVLSRGERRGESTWALRAGDLQDLRLTLNDGVPDAFDVRIEVLAPTGFAAADSIARVRLAGAPRVESAAAAPAKVAPVKVAAPSEAPAVAVLASMEAPTPLRTVASEAPKREKLARVTPAVVEIERRTVQPAPQAEARHWPEGASGLGAIARGSDRQVWWKLPGPAWSPFHDTADR